MPKVTINKGGFNPAFYTHNGTVDFDDFDIIFSSKNTLRAVAAHEGIHARQQSDLARYHVAKADGDIEKGLEAFRQNLKERGFNTEIEDDSFYRAAIKRKPPMVEGSAEWKKTEKLAHAGYDRLHPQTCRFRSSIELIDSMLNAAKKYFQNPLEVEAFATEAKVAGSSFQDFYRQKLGFLGIKSEKIVTPIIEAATKTSAELGIN